GKRGVLGNVTDSKASVRQEFARAARAVDFHARRNQFTSQFCQTLFVADADKRPPYRNPVHVCLSVGIRLRKPWFKAAPAGGQGRPATSVRKSLSQQRLRFIVRGVLLSAGRPADTL